jgi:DNA polymerase
VNNVPLYIDFETRSPVDLKTAGLGRYAKHPQTEPLMMAYAFGDDPVFLVEDHKLTGHHAAVASHIEAGGIVVAHNAQFELAIFNFIMAKRYGWPRLAISQVRCTMAASYAQALPGALENAAHALGLNVAKDIEGRALMLKMCKPRSAAGDPLVYTYHDSPEMRARLGEYCKQDVAVEREIYKRVLPLMDREQRLWELDQVINLRGIPFDMPSLEAALVVADKEKERLNA